MDSSEANSQSAVPSDSHSDPSDVTHPSFASVRLGHIAAETPLVGPVDDQIMLQLAEQSLELSLTVRGRMVLFYSGQSLRQSVHLHGDHMPLVTRLHAVKVAVELLL